MKFIYILLIPLHLCIFPGKAFTQQVYVTYLQKINIDHRPKDMGINWPDEYAMFTLRSDPYASLWVQDSIYYGESDFFEKGWKNSIRGVYEYRDKVSHISYIHNLIYNQNEFEETILVKDEYSCGGWRIIKNKNKTILGMECIRAERECYGRPEFLYFCPEIPIIDGPVFFNEIPGLILEYFTNSSDHYIASSIKAIEGHVIIPKKMKIVQASGPTTKTRLVVSKSNYIPLKWINLADLYLVDLN